MTGWGFFLTLAWVLVYFWFVFTQDVTAFERVATFGIMILVALVGEDMRRR